MVGHYIQEPSPYKQCDPYELYMKGPTDAGSRERRKKECKRIKTIHLQIPYED